MRFGKERNGNTQNRRDLPQNSQNTATGSMVVRENWGSPGEHRSKPSNHHNRHSGGRRNLGENHSRHERTEIPDDVRRAVDQRDNRTCHCGRGEPEWAVEHHHIVEVIDGGRHTVGNIETDCLRCHRDEHIRRGDTWAAQKIEERIEKSKGGHTRRWLRRLGGGR